MEICLNRKEFVEILQSVASFVAKGESTEMILRQAKISTIGDKIKIQGTNIDASIISTLSGVNVVEDGEILLPCVNALKVLKESSDELCTLKNDGNFTSIILDGACFKLNTGETFSVKEFYEIPDPVTSKKFKMLSTRLEEMIHSIIFCCAHEASRYTLGGALFCIGNGKLETVTTDGKRLALTSEGIEYTGELEKIIIPEKGLSLLKGVPNKEEFVNVSFNANHVWFHFGTTIISLKLLEGRFPKFQDVIPKSNPHLVEIDVKELLSKIKQATLFTNEKSRLVRLKISNNRIDISSHSSGTGEAEISCDATYSGDEFEIGINPDYLKESLQLWKEDKATLQLKDEETAILIESKVSTVLNLIMPVSLKS